MTVRRRSGRREAGRPAASFRVRTDDGVELLGARLGDPPGAGRPALVFCHGFLGWHRKPSLLPFQRELARRFAVYAFDFRGHGGSEGTSAFGALEHLDVDAVVRQARNDGASVVCTLGGSMGGIAVIRHGALIGGVDAVVAISTPASWDGHRSRAVRRMVWLTGTTAGRAVLRAAGARVSADWRRTEAPADLVERISPIPLVIVHGRDDHYFDEEEAWTLYRRAREPKRLLLAGRFGHAEDGYSADLAARLERILVDSIPA
jgi:uncharacterized protein